MRLVKFIISNFVLLKFIITRARGTCITSRGPAGRRDSRRTTETQLRAAVPSPEPTPPPTSPTDTPLPARPLRGRLRYEPLVISSRFFRLRQIRRALSVSAALWAVSQHFQDGFVHALRIVKINASPSEFLSLSMLII